MSKFSSNQADSASDHRPSIMDILPNELLATVFSAGTAQWIANNPHKYPFPFRVSLVCRHWRLLALRTPELWVVVYPPLHKLDTTDQSQMWVARWLERAGDLSLTFILDDLMWVMNYTGVQITKQALEGCLRAILPHSNRVRLLDISLIGYFDTLPLNSLLDLFQDGLLFEQLRQLSVCGPIRYTGREELQYALRGLPNLRKIRWSHSVPPFLENMTTLSILRLRPLVLEFQDLLNSCPNLQTLILLEITSIPEGVRLPQTITLSSLKTLALSVDHQFRTNIYPFVFLKLPNLKYLELDGPMNVSQTLRDSLGGCKLETLRLSNRSKGSNFREDQRYFQTLLNDVQVLEFVESTSADILSDVIHQPDLRRKRSAGSLFRLPPTSLTAAPSTASYSNLKTITMDTIAHGEVLNLCRFINLHRQVERVNLSINSHRHLKTSLLRNGNIISVEPTLMTGKKASSTFKAEVSGTRDVKEWLERLVKVHTIKSSAGLLDGEKITQRPFRELD
ncbi:hypothetical protein CPB83DRAFT_886301 [Crepidotus variabilis]|uniref:F-box domain-containing protein n=1 Tax=Crepidotus variabilis TaxID=179855 RepID=A0A9P6E8I1_9AGAR|nr:hypothetical protein CPB83DRAFT_886301 [Crepidotus variabilis]